MTLVEVLHLSEQDDAVLHYIMISTVLTPKLISLFDLIEHQYKDEKIIHYTKKSREQCKKCIHKSILSASKSTGIEPKVLRMSMHAYFIIDDAITTASIKEKIHYWNLCYAIACRQQQQVAPFQLKLPEFVPLNCGFVELSRDEICMELEDYAEEIECWLDNYFEYDDFSTDSRYDEIVEVMANLRLLASKLPEC